MNIRVRRAATVRQTEVVETYNLAISLKRLRDAPNYDEDRWKRALYHAVGMSVHRGAAEKIRTALELP